MHLAAEGERIERGQELFRQRRLAKPYALLERLVAAGNEFAPEPAAFGAVSLGNIETNQALLTIRPGERATGSWRADCLLTSRCQSPASPSPSGRTLDETMRR